jgi:hypothetical protein
VWIIHAVHDFLLPINADTCELGFDTFLTVLPGLGAGWFVGVYRRYGQTEPFFFSALQLAIEKFENRESVTELDKDYRVWIE